MKHKHFKMDNIWFVCGEFTKYFLCLSNILKVKNFKTQIKNSSSLLMLNAFHVILLKVLKLKYNTKYFYDLLDIHYISVKFC